jgi:hypothetical protein
MGTSTQMGRSFGVTVIINEFSSPSDQKILLEAFQQKGNEGLVNALSQMSSKGALRSPARWAATSRMRASFRCLTAQPKSAW